MTRRGFGSVGTRKGREGLYIQFHAGGRRFQRRFATLEGVTVAEERRLRKEGERKLRAIRMMLEIGQPLDDVLAIAFGDARGSNATFKKLLPAYLADAARTKRGAREEAYRLKRVNRTAPWVRKPIGEVTPRDVQSWLQQHCGKLSGASWNRTKSAISAVFAWAQLRGYLEENPARHRLVERKREAAGREIYLDRDEWIALLEASEPCVRPFLKAAVLTGARQGALLQLRWADVDLKRRQIRLRAETTKTQTARTIRMPSALWRELGDLRRRGHDVGDGDPVFVLDRGTPLQKHHVRHRWEAARKAADLPAEKRGVTLHDLRHSCASWLAKEGIPLLDISRVLGHKTPTMTYRYAHFSPESGKAAADALDRALEGDDGDLGDATGEAKEQAAQ